MSFEEIRYKGKAVKPDKGFTGKLSTINVAIEHNSDGSVTVCKEIADEIYGNRRVPKSIRKMFEPTKPISFMFDDFSGGVK